MGWGVDTESLSIRTQRLNLAQRNSRDHTVKRSCEKHVARDGVRSRFIEPLFVFYLQCLLCLTRFLSSHPLKQ
jgi:hypothetical protein